MMTELDILRHYMEKFEDDDNIPNRAILELSDSIKSLTDTTTALWKRIETIESALFTRTDIKMPPTGPVLNDGKGRFDPDTHLPFVTGLTVNDAVNDGKPSEEAVRKWMMLPDYCTCGETDTWFDRTMTTDGKGNVLQDMCDRCCTCGKEVKPTPTDEELMAKFLQWKRTKNMPGADIITLGQLIAEVRGKEGV